MCQVPEEVAYASYKAVEGVVTPNGALHGTILEYSCNIGYRSGPWDEGYLYLYQVYTESERINIFIHFTPRTLKPSCPCLVLTPPPVKPALNIQLTERGLSSNPMICHQKEAAPMILGPGVVIKGGLQQPQMLIVSSIFPPAGNIMELPLNNYRDVYVRHRCSPTLTLVLQLLTKDLNLYICNS